LPLPSDLGHSLRLGHFNFNFNIVLLFHHGLIFFDYLFWLFDADNLLDCPPGILSFGGNLLGWTFFLQNLTLLLLGFRMLTFLLLLLLKSLDDIGDQLHDLVVLHSGDFK
jgi:hypothetical protein